MTDAEAVSILRTLATADEFGEWAATQLLSRLQLALPDRDWFLLAAREVPGMRVWDPHGSEDPIEAGPAEFDEG